MVAIRWKKATFCHKNQTPLFSLTVQMLKNKQYVWKRNIWNTEQKMCFFNEVGSRSAELCMELTICDQKQLKITFILHKSGENKAYTCLFTFSSITLPRHVKHLIQAEPSLLLDGRVMFPLKESMLLIVQQHIPLTSSCWVTCML